MSRIYVALSSFACEESGESYHVNAGSTVREGHPLLAGREDLFGPLAIDFEYEQPVKKVAARRGGAS